MRRLREYLPNAPNYTFIEEKGGDLRVYYRRKFPRISINLHIRGNTFRFDYYYMRDGECLYDYDCHGETVEFRIGDELYLSVLCRPEIIGDIHEAGCVITNDFLMYEESRDFDYMICRHCGKKSWFDFKGGDECKDMTKFIKHTKECSQTRLHPVTFLQLLAAVTMHSIHHRVFVYALELCT